MRKVQSCVFLNLSLPSEEVGFVSWGHSAVNDDWINFTMNHRANGFDVSEWNCVGRFRKRTEYPMKGSLVRTWSMLVGVEIPSYNSHG